MKLMFVCNLCRKTAALDFSLFFYCNASSRLEEEEWTGELTECSDQMCYSFAAHFDN
jgi:hypothetical protein